MICAIFAKKLICKHKSIHSEVLVGPGRCNHFIFAFVRLLLSKTQFRLFSATFNFNGSHDIANINFILQIFSISANRQQ